MAGWPDGTLVFKTQTRAPGCSYDGGLPFAIPCPGQSEAPNSVMVVVDPKAMKVLDWTELKGNVASRVAATVYDGKQYAYIGNSSNLFRYLWDGHNITEDTSWQPERITKPGQTNLLANMISGDWIFDFTNCCPPTTTPLSVVSVSQANASKINRINPIPLEPGRQSYIPSNSAVDPVNHMLYVPDAGAGKLVGLKYDPMTGNMSVAWDPEEMKTFGWVNAISPKDQRVLVGTNMKVENESNIQPGPINATYTEQVMWRDAETGKLLAASDYFTPMSSGSQVVPGYGGLIYHALIDGHIMALKVLPAPANTTSTANVPTATGATPMGD
ncbi:MAG: hypothetical protein WA941_10585 [Nitrososphaeraceae archaeon]